MDLDLDPFLYKERIIQGHSSHWQTSVQLQNLPTHYYWTGVSLVLTMILPKFYLFNYLLRIDAFSIRTEHNN